MVNKTFGIKVFMVFRNISTKEVLFNNVIQQASKLTKDFYFVNHGSTDNTTTIINNLTQQYNLTYTYINEPFEGTMDEMKGKHYNILRNMYINNKNQVLNNKNFKQFILILDRDEVLSDELIEEIKEQDMKYNVYLINRKTFFIKNIIDKKTYLPLLFEINSVEIGPFAKFHKLYKIKDKKVKKLKNILWHYSYINITDFLNKTLYYAKGEAEDLFEKKKNIKNINIFRLFLKESIMYFGYNLIRHKNWEHFEGWMFCFSNIVYMFFKYLFYYELKQKNNKI